MKFKFFMLGCVLAGTACSDGRSAQPVTEQTVTLPAIAPTDFVIVPCAVAAPTSECVIIAAGGKRVLIGAPAGIGAGKIAGEDIPPDAVIFLSLHADVIEGLDEVRNRTWRAGRRSPLSVAGPDGVAQLVGAINKAYVTSDALAYVEGKRDGGFDQEAITARLIGPGEVAFDTGDLTISALSGGGAKLALLINYEGQTVLLAACGAEETDIATWPQVDMYIGCNQVGYSAPVFGSWPLTDRIFLTK